jgi:hypothetical protein
MGWLIVEALMARKHSDNSSHVEQGIEGEARVEAPDEKPQDNQPLIDIIQH